jgi:hypothetical protein
MVVSFVLLVVSTMATATAAAAMSSQFNVRYTINHLTQTIHVTNVDNNAVLIQPIAPHSNVDDERYSGLHQFPGVTTQVLFPAIARTDVLHVLLNNGVLLRTQATRVYTNYHVHKQRLVYGQLLTFALDDFSLAAKIYVGAPIFRDNKLVSVVTCRYDDYTAGLALFPVSGIRPRGLISGQYMVDKRVEAQALTLGYSVYGRVQLPYAEVKAFALTTSDDRQSYRNRERSANVFYNDDDVIITLTEGDFEIDRIRFDGPLIVPQK